MDYQVIFVSASGPMGTDFKGAAAKLATAVREQISLGWEPTGGVAVGETAALKITHLFQAMIKRR